jgi:hypothetical protein
MGWAAIITALVQLFGPILAEWLKKWLDSLLNSAAARVAAPETFTTPAAATAAMFDEAVSGLPRLAFARRSLLRRLKAAAMPRAGAVFGAAGAAAAVSAVPAITSDEWVELRDVAGAAEQE